jgi:hypothetical protein
MGSRHREFLLQELTESLGIRKRKRKEERG